LRRFATKKVAILEHFQNYEKSGSVRFGPQSGDFGHFFSASEFLLCNLYEEFLMKVVYYSNHDVIVITVAQKVAVLWPKSGDFVKK